MSLAIGEGKYNVWRKDTIEKRGGEVMLFLSGYLKLWLWMYLNDERWNATGKKF